MRLPPDSDSRWALAWLLGLLIVLLLLMAGPRLHAQTGNESEPPSLTSSLEQSEQMLMLLVQRLGERQKQVSELQSSLLTADARLSDLLDSLVSLQQQLSQAQESQAQSEMALTETLSSFDALSTQYDALETAWQAYRDEMTKQVGDVTRDYQRARRWAVGFGVASVIVVIVSVVLATR